MKSTKKSPAARKPVAGKKTQCKKATTPHKAKPVAGKAKSKKTEKRVEASYPHFRHYKKSGHPALIVGEQVAEKEEYKFRKVMHSEKDGKRNNECVYPNPDPKDKKPMYIGKRVRHDDKEAFDKRPLSWIYPNKKK